MNSLPVKEYTFDSMGKQIHTGLDIYEKLPKNWIINPKGCGKKYNDLHTPSDNRVIFIHENKRAPRKEGLLILIAGLIFTE